MTQSTLPSICLITDAADAIGPAYHIAHGSIKLTIEDNLSVLDDSYVLIINKGQTPIWFVLNGKLDSLEANHFNMFYLPAGGCRWTLGEGSSLLAVMCEKSWLESRLLKNPIILKDFLTGLTHKARILNRRSVKLSPYMDTLACVLIGRDAKDDMHYWYTSVKLLSHALTHSENQYFDDFFDLS